MKTTIQKLALLIAMLIAVLPAAAAIGDSFQYEGFSFRVIEEANNGEPGKVTVVGHSISGDITIPTQVPYSSDVYYVTEIDGYAFIRDNSITSVTLPNTVTKIGYAAFYNCASLKTVEFGTNLISIGDDAFYFCTSLSSLTFPSTLTSIGDRSFWGCSSLKSIDIPNSVTEVKTHAFTACSSLESVTISDRSVDNSMGTMIRGEMFMGCTSLKSLTINAKTILDENAIACGSLAILNINAETTIGKNAFAGCSFTSLTLPDYVTEIDEAAFSNCQLLMSANVDATTIGTRAFHFCTSMSSLEIGDNVSSIDEFAFKDCNQLEEVYSYNTNPPLIPSSNNAFSEETTRNATLYVPNGCRDKYAAAEGWKEFFNIVEMRESGIEGVDNEDVDIRVVDGSIVIDGAAADATVEIYDTTDKMMYRGSAGEIPSMPSGIYIVRIGGNSVKVAV